MERSEAQEVPSKPGRFILCTLGTRGDIEPFAAIARRLVRAGHCVDILTNENWRDFVEESGARFVPIAPADPTQSGRDDFAFFVESVLPSFERSFDHIANVVESDGQPVLAYRLNMLGAECAAERFGLPSVRVALQPSSIRSRHRPAWPLTAAAQGWWGGAGRRLLIPAVYLVGDLLSPYRRHTNRFRKSAGVAPRRLLAKEHGSDERWLMLCPEWFSMPQEDWPQLCTFAGFPASRSVCADARAAEFLRRHKRPIVFTPGTGVTDVAPLLEAADQVSAALDSPAIFLSPFADAAAGSERLLVLPFVDLGWLLPHCLAVVHHGGIGTTAEAIRAGIPQLILAGRFDQPDNGVRVAQLGLGGAILSDRPGPALIGEAMRQILASSHVAAQVATASKLIRDQDGAAGAADLLVGLLGSRAVRSG